jgi:hypothetical protein
MIRVFHFTANGMWLASRSDVLLSSWFGLFWNIAVGDWASVKALYLPTTATPMVVVSSLEASVTVKFTLTRYEWRDLAVPL